MRRVIALLITALALAVAVSLPAAAKPRPTPMRPASYTDVTVIQDNFKSYSNCQRRREYLGTDGGRYLYTWCSSGREWNGRYWLYGRYNVVLP